MSVPGFRRVNGACRCPSIVAGIVSAAGVQDAKTVVSTPDDHLHSIPNRCVCIPTGRCTRDRGRYPSICYRIIFSTGVVIGGSISAPHDHFRAVPHCRVAGSRRRRVVRAGSCPRVRRGVVSATSVQVSAAENCSTPHNHLAASPHCCVTPSASRCVCCAGRCPCVCRGIVSPTGV